MKIMRKVSIAKKMTILTVSVLVFLIITGSMSVMTMSGFNDRMMLLYEDKLMTIALIDEIKTDVEFIRAQSNSIIEAGNDDDTKEPIQTEILEKATALTTTIKDYADEYGQPELVTYYSNFTDAMNAFLDAYGVGTIQQMGMQATDGEMPDTLDEGSGEAVNTEMSNFDDARVEIIVALNDLMDTQVTDAETSYTEGESIFVIVRSVLIGLIAVCVILTILLSYFIVKSVVEPIKEVKDKLDDIAGNGGDLTQRLPEVGKDEITALSISFNEFIRSLQVMIKNISESSNVLTTASDSLSTVTQTTTESLEEITQTVVEIAAATQENASAMTQTRESLESMMAFSEETSKISQMTTEKGKDVEANADNGLSEINEVVSSIKEIAEASHRVLEQASNLDHSSKEIGDIINIITGISEQTNLLALNAAIEAARAGEAGRGFNVVAKEIGVLAEESKRAAQEIAKRVNENQSQSKIVVSEISTVDEKVTFGVAKATAVTEIIKQITDEVHTMVSQIEQIAVSNREQNENTKEAAIAIQNVSNGSSEIAEGTERISGGVEEQLSTMFEMENTAEQMAELAKELRNMTKGFIV